MATIILRNTKGSPLLTTEIDANFNNINQELITKLPTSSYTASDVLAKLVTVDGTGSGLDADLLDGLNTSSILPVASNKSSVVTRDSSGNFSANIITATVTNANNLTGAVTNGFISKIGIDNNIARIITGSGSDITVANGDGIFGNPTISAGSNLAKQDSANSYTLTQNFVLIVANGLSNDSNNNLFAGLNNLSTTSTNGFIYVPTITGLPSNVPSINAGRSPIVWDATNNKMWVYSGGQWNSIATVQTIPLASLPSLTVTQAANAATITLGAFTADFRNASLTSGVPNTRTLSGNASLVIPSGATLGVPAIGSISSVTGSGVVSGNGFLLTLNTNPPVPIQIGDVFAGANIPTNTKVIAFGSYLGGVGGGTIVLSNSVSTTATAATFTKPSRVLILAIDNSGTIEAAIVNQSGGNNLDETGLISTTSVSAGSTANNVVYSSTARTNVPYKVVGFMDFANPAAGQYSVTNLLVTSASGRELAAMWGIGLGQTWQNVTTQRALSQNYVNTKNRPITANIFWSCSAGSATFTVAGVVVATTNAASSGSWFIVIGAGESYGFTSVSGNYGVQLFVEKS